ncbi:MAG: glycosyltransferase family 2 protein [Phycisphaerae bacterium]|nr:glycosyltransferase family 2 protein [Phycisphaerae bacterium]
MTTIAPQTRLIEKPIEVLLPVSVNQTQVRAPTRVAVIIITWNRKGYVTNVLRALSRQTYPPSQLDVVVVDNAGTDGTLDHLRELFRPERVVFNDARVAHEPRFREPIGLAGGNRLGLGSLTLVRNASNFGGCGGFNTGFSYVDAVLDGTARSPGERPTYVWLVDDDIDLPEGTLANLVVTAERDENIGLVGSRTMDINNRENTIETTIYFDPTTGLMGDEAPRGHRLEQSHREWVSRVGGTRGERYFSGIRDVDIVSACSMLARWSGVKKVGFWDYRYFIYCDDADWCLRFAKAGYRVVLSLDAVVYHTPWHHKLTPARAYYAMRNIMWVLRKVLPLETQKRALPGWFRRILWESGKALIYRRLFAAEIARRQLDDMVTGWWGKLDDEGPAFADLFETMRAAKLLTPKATIAVMCPRADMIAWGDELRGMLAEKLRSAGRAGDMPRFVYVVRNDAPDPGAAGAGAPERVVYSTRWRSKVRRQLEFFEQWPDAVVVFDQTNDFPLLYSCPNIHIDRRQATKAQIEWGGWLPRIVIGAKLLRTAWRAWRYWKNLAAYESNSRYG